jgi:uncharacterized repeat protein (TIGR01451 family)
VSLTCSLGTIANGADSSFDITVNPTQVGNVTNTASVDSDIDDQDETNNVSNDVATEIFEEGTILADISIIKIADSSEVNTGETIEYTLIATNNGPSTAVNVTVSDKLPSQVEFVSSVPIPSSENGKNLSWNFNSIANSDSEIITIIVQVKDNVPDGTTISNFASIISETDDPEDDNNESPHVETDVNPPEDDKIERGDNQWDKRPTFGINHETRETMLVENGFSFNGESFTITDNHHTPFDQQLINIGTENSFIATVYADKRLMIQEFLFGIFRNTWNWHGSPGRDES